MLDIYLRELLFHLHGHGFDRGNRIFEWSVLHVSLFSIRGKVFWDRFLSCPFVRNLCPAAFF